MKTDDSDDIYCSITFIHDLQVEP